MKKGVVVFDGIAVMEFTVSFLGHSMRLDAKAAFVNSETGHSHGQTTCTQWSPAVVAQLKMLREAMEEDLAQIHFSTGSDATSNPKDNADLGGGIGEKLSDESGNPQA